MRTLRQKVDVEPRGVAGATNPEVYPNWINFRFPGRGQRETTIADVRGIVEIVMLLPGRHAARIRRQAAELLCRYLGGDLALVDEVCRNRGFQEQLAVQGVNNSTPLSRKCVTNSTP